MKRCFLIVGAESSGNRMLGKLLVNAGCIGDESENGPFSQALPTAEQDVVVIRSYPHGNEWPDLADIYCTLRERGYSVRVLVTVRDRHCTIQSQVHHQNHPQSLAQGNIHRAYKDIFSGINAVNVDYLMVPYEANIQPEQQITLLHTLGLRPQAMKCYDGNAQYADAPTTTV